MEDFVLKFQSFEGCIEILKCRDIEDILSVVSGITGIVSGDLGCIEVDALGTTGVKVPYREVLRDLKRDVAFFRRLYQKLRDPHSKNTLFSVIRYWLLPDKDFLKAALSRDKEIENRNLYGDQPVITISKSNEIKDHIEEIRDMKPGEFLCFESEQLLLDLAVVFELLSVLRKDLFFSLRMNDIRHIVLYAFSPVPKIERLKQKHNKLKVVSIAKDPFAWRNEELLKDKGLVPYLLHRDYGYSSVMVGLNNGDYPYLSDYLNGLEMEFLPDGSQEEKCKWISEHAEEADILIVNGLYPVNMDILKIYEEKNPDGLIYLPLDANSEWMDRILHNDPYFSDMLKHVDVIGSSGRKMQRHLNEKWPWVVEYFPNGFFHPWIDIETIDFDKKENIILTVGRLGTEQKATDVMLEAFAEAADRIPEWKLRLIGSIEPSFDQFIEGYFMRYPALKDRVEFAGKIIDKIDLFKEYLRAKVFSLTSILEGGPNVVAEALHCGCAMATTEYDAFEDATDNGKCGMSAPIGDVKGMAEVFSSLCGDQDKLKDMCRHAFEYAARDYSMDKIVSRIQDSLSGAV